MELSIHVTKVGAHDVVSLAGEVDVATLPRLADALLRALGPGRRLVVDLDGVHVLDDAALGLLLGAAGRARLSEGDLVVVASAPVLRDRLALTGFDRAVTVVASVSAAG
jgi:anti-sigma B factor antagonist